MDPHLILFGCLYSAQGIETALKGVFRHKKMTKVGILAASVEQPSTNLFTNYNGVGDARVGYIIPPDCDTVQTWEVARSTSAAPMYFPPKYVPELGRSFQDGGVLRNNPTIVGLSEFSALTRDTRPDLIINLGTGSEPKPERQARFWHDSWPVRLVRAYMSLMQGRSTWNDAACLVKRESRHTGHYRLDIALESEVCLDDVSAMPLLRSVVLEDTTFRCALLLFRTDLPPDAGRLPVPHRGTDFVYTESGGPSRTTDFPAASQLYASHQQ
ncbi:hypothetical protein F5Y08DRAFT_138165 [Xylaria arbuscula]|nr:hypothetical protein F5Y08DRAFT_138165 [Xylaria arbuscula]